MDFILDTTKSTLFLCFPYKFLLHYSLTFSDKQLKNVPKDWGMRGEKWGTDTGGHRLFSSPSPFQSHSILVIFVSAHINYTPSK